MADPVTCTIEQGIATITLDDGKANALSPGLIAAVHAALDRAQAESATVVLWRSAGVSLAASISPSPLAAAGR